MDHISWLGVGLGETSSVAGGAVAGLGAGLLVAAALGELWMFEGKTVRHLAINVGYMLVGLTIVGTVIGPLQTP